MFLTDRMPRAMKLGLSKTLDAYVEIQEHLMPGDTDAERRAAFLDSLAFNRRIHDDYVGWKRNTAIKRERSQQT